MLLLAGVTDFCMKTSPIWQFVGYILLVFKIVIPLLLLILGMVDLGKAVVESDDKAISKAAMALAKRAAAAVIIFFIPTLVGFIFTIVSGFQENADIRNNYENCKSCLVSPTGDKCKGLVTEANR